MAQNQNPIQAQAQGTGQGQNLAVIPGILWVDDPEETEDPDEAVKFNEQQQQRKFVLYLGRDGAMIIDMEDLPARRYQMMKEEAEQVDQVQFREVSAMELMELFVDNLFEANLDVMGLSEEEKEQIQEAQQRMQRQKE